MIRFRPSATPHAAPNVAYYATSQGASLDVRAVLALLLHMNLAEEDQAFLRDLVKTSRQKIHHVEWTDRDGTARQTSLTGPEVVRLNSIAQRLRTSKSEVLRQAAHVPVAK